MNGPLAQIVALTCYGNAFLAGRTDASLSPTNSTCAFCERVVFVVVERTLLGRRREKVVASSPDEWLADARKRKAVGIRLARTPQNEGWLSDRMSAALVGGGGTWTVEVLFPGGSSESWIASWDVGDRNAPDRRIWRVTYGLAGKGASKPDSPADLQPAIRELAGSLAEIRAFSARHKLDGFTKQFDGALDTIASGGKNQRGYHRDLAPAGFLSGDAALLLDACQQAWVFGGMGSWNDLGFEGEEERKAYGRVSDRLFLAVNLAIEQAASSTLKRGGASP